MDNMINPNTVQTLREFAQAMPVAFRNITEATCEMNKRYGYVSNNSYVGGGHFEDMFRSATLFQENAEDAMKHLPAELKKLASAIEGYINTKLGGMSPIPEQLKKD